MSTQEFFESYIKEDIISKFAEYSTLHRGEDLVYMRDITENKPILTMASIEGTEDVKKFCLTNVVYFNKFKYKAEKYAITGILSTLNNGRCIITACDVSNN